MKKLLITLFLTLGLIGTAHSNILYDLIGKMSYKDVKFYDIDYETGDYYESLDYAVTNFKAKIKNLNQKDSIKRVSIIATTLDCKKGCNSCLTVAEEEYSVGLNKLLPNNIFQVDINLRDKTGEKTYVQPPGNITCWTTYIDKVEGYSIFD